MKFILFLLLSGRFAVCADPVILPGDTQSLRVKYGVTSISISNESQYMTLRLESIGDSSRCGYKVIYGAISINDNVKVSSILKESKGIFNERSLKTSSHLIWPGDNIQEGLIRNIFMTWSAGSEEFGYIYVPKDVSILIGFESP